MNKIICGDALEKLKEIESESIDLVVTSPPYDNLRDYGGYTFNFEGIAKGLFRVTKQGGVVVWVVGDTTKDFCETLTSFKQAIYFVENCGFNLLDTMIYAKKSYPPAYPTLRRFANTFEYMFVFSKGKPKTFNPIKNTKELRSIITKDKISTFRQKDGSTKETKIKADKLIKSECNVWVYDVGFNKTTTDKFAFKHPAMFPETLAEDHILSWSNEGDTILDPFAGSGTTLKMAKKNNRNYIGIELNDEYIKIAEARLKAVPEPLTQFEVQK